MKLSRALRLQPGTILTFTGAGGKTSAMARLARELSPEGIPLLLTATTKLGEGQEALASHHLITDRPPRELDLQKLLQTHRSVLLTGPSLADEGKWSGVPPDWVDGLGEAVAAIGGILAVEGDGARQRGIKGPAGHEPVVPASSGLVVPVASLLVLGQPLSDEIAHRPERISRIAGLAPGEPLTIEAVARLLTSADGGLKAIPAGAAIRPLLTGAKGEKQIEGGRSIAGGCLGEGRMEAVCLADLEREEPVREVVGRAAGVVLAAGGGSRMGGLKQVETWRGRPLVSYALQAALAGGCSPVILVVGQEADRVRAAAAGAADLVLENSAWEDGQSTSVRIGLEGAQKARVEAAVFLLADMPLVESELVRRLRHHHARTLAPIVAPRAKGRWGNPVLFDRSTFEALAKIEGDRGGRALYDRFAVEGVPADRSALIDIDTDEDWERL